MEGHHPPSKEDCCRRRRHRILVLALVGSLILFTLGHTLNWISPCRPKVGGVERVSVAMGENMGDLPTVEVEKKYIRTGIKRHISHPDRLYQRLEGFHAQEILDQIEDLGLASPGSLHLTDDPYVPVVSAAEFAILSKHGFTSKEVEDIAIMFYFGYAIITVDCLGFDTRQKDGEVAAFLRVQSINWNNARRHMQELYEERVRKDGDLEDLGLFTKDSWSPHVVVAWSTDKGWKDHRLAAHDNLCAANVKMVGDPF